MAQVLGGYSASDVQAGTPGTRIWRAIIDIGATGAPTVNGDPGITVTRNTTGLYDVVFPPVPDYTKTIPLLRVWVQKSAAATVSQATLLAYDPAAGTAQFKTALNTAGTGVDPANGDQIALKFTAGTQGSR